MKKFLRFLVAWTVGPMFIFLCYCISTLVFFVFWLEENEYEKDDVRKTNIMIFQDWWKWASFKEIK